MFYTFFNSYRKVKVLLGSVYVFIDGDRNFYIYYLE